MNPVAAVSPTLSGVQQTLLIPLSARVLESKRPDSTFRDPEAERIAARLDVDFARFSQEWTIVEMVVGRTHLLDVGVRDFLARSGPKARVVSLGAGLCTRWHRVNDGTVRWLDLDLPDVIALKERLVEQSDHYRLLSGSVLEDDWMEEIAPDDGPLLFVAEGLLMYLPESEVVALLRRLSARYPGAEMWLETLSPLLLRTFGRASRSIGVTGAKFAWGLSDPAELTKAVPGVRVLAVQHPNEVHPERWRWMKILRYVRPLHTAAKCIHVKLP